MSKNKPNKYVFQPKRDFKNFMDDQFKGNQAQVIIIFLIPLLLLNSFALVYKNPLLVENFF